MYTARQNPRRTTKARGPLGNARAILTYPRIPRYTLIEMSGGASSRESQSVACDVNQRRM